MFLYFEGTERLKFCDKSVLTEDNVQVYALTLCSAFKAFQARAKISHFVADKRQFSALSQ